MLVLYDDEQWYKFHCLTYGLLLGISYVFPLKLEVSYFWQNFNFKLYSKELDQKTTFANNKPVRI